MIKDWKMESSRESSRISIDNATRMLEGSKLTLEEIATYSGLSIDQVRELKEKGERKKKEEKII